MSNKYKYKKKPYKHQVRALKNLLRREWGGALLMEPRTGKTKVGIDYASVLHQFKGVNRVLIVCPVVAFEVWKDQFAENCPYPYRLTIWDRKSRKEQELPRPGKDILDVVVINYDAFSTPGDWQRDRKTGEIRTDAEGNKLRSKSKGGRFTLKSKILKWQPQLIILDESHRIKTPSAKKSTALHSIGKVADHRVILTGTVVTKSKRLFDVYSQWKFLYPERFGGMNFADFKAEYGKFKSMGNYEKFIETKNEQQLHDLIHLDSFSVTREECYDLPPMTSQVFKIELDGAAKAYDDMAEDMVARIESGEYTEASIALVQRLRLQQITSGFIKTSPNPQHPQSKLKVISNEKLQAIEDRLEDLMEADEKVVIGAVFKADIARLIQVGKRLKVPTFAIHGGVKQKDRAPIPKMFNNTKGPAIFIGQPAAAGEAIDLSAASIMQWYSLPSSWVHFRQFSDRIALSSKPTFHEFYLARGTVDELMYDVLLHDGEIGKKMIQSPELLLRNGGF